MANQQYINEMTVEFEKCQVNVPLQSYNIPTTSLAVFLAFWPSSSFDNNLFQSMEKLRMEFCVKTVEDYLKYIDVSKDPRLVY